MEPWEQAVQSEDPLGRMGRSSSSVRSAFCSSNMVSPLTKALCRCHRAARSLILEQRCRLRTAKPGAGCVLRFTINSMPLSQYSLVTIFLDKLVLAKALARPSPRGSVWIQAVGVSDVWGFEIQLLLI